ncbi:hypothetical protein [Roseibium album]|uniref:hypothetical protein n=1 Tax=Roseibium album TaxID=311410 RepID=UPI0018C91224|nr:hypothetical protein [Labrenzia sp. EL_195]
MTKDDYAALRKRMLRYSEANGYPISRYENIRCKCGQSELRLFSDDTQGGAYAECPTCQTQIDIMDSREYVEDLFHNVCSCCQKELLLNIGVAVYDDGSDDVRWVYIGGLCRKCNLAGVYVDWHER